MQDFAHVCKAVIISKPSAESGRADRPNSPMAESIRQPKSIGALMDALKRAGTRDDAKRELISLGHPAAKVVVMLLSDNELKDVAQEILVSIGEPAIGCLLRTGAWHLRASAAKTALLAIAQKTRKVAGVCVRALDKDDERPFATDVLLELARSGQAAVVGPLTCAAIRNPATMKTAESILVIILRQNPKAVVNACLGALASESALEQERATDLLFAYSAIDPRVVANACVGVLRNPRQSAPAMVVLRRMTEDHARFVAKPAVGALSELEMYPVIARVLLYVASRHSKAVIGYCIAALADDERRENAKKIMLKIAEKDPRIVARFCAAELRMDERRIYVTDILHKIAETRLAQVMDACAFFLVDPQAADHAQKIVRILAAKYPNSAAKACEYALTSERIPASAKEALAQIMASTANVL